MSQMSISRSGEKFRLKMKIGPNYIDQLITASSLDAHIKLHITKSIRAYVRHRREALRRKERLDPIRAQAVKSLLRAMDYAPSWSIEKLAQVILRKHEDLVLLAPPSSSRYFRYSTQVLHDLQQWAINWLR